MAGFGEPWQWTKDRLSEAASYFPTLSVSNPDDNLDVDAFRDSIGQLPSLFTQSAMGIANYARSLFPEQAPSATSYERPPQFASSAEEMAAGRAVQMGRAAPAPEAAPYQGFGTPSEIAMRGIRSLTDPFSINQEGIDWIMEAAERSGRRQAPFIQAVTGEKPAGSALDFFQKSQAAYGAPEAQSAETAGRALYTGYVTSDVPGLKSVAETVSSPLTLIGGAASEALSPVIKGLPLISRGLLGLADVGIEGGVAARTIQQAAMAGGAEIGAEYAKEQGYGMLGQLGAGLSAGAIAGGISAAPSLAAKTFKQVAEEAITAPSRAVESSSAALEETIRRQSQAFEDYLRYQTYGMEVPPVRTEAVPAQRSVQDAINEARYESLKRAVGELPPVEEGYVRLYRGVNQNLQGEKFVPEGRTMFTQELLPPYQYGQTHYLDIPEEVFDLLSKRSGYAARIPVPERFARESIPIEPLSSGFAREESDALIKSRLEIPEMRFNQLTSDDELLGFEQAKTQSTRSENLSPKTLEELRAGKVYTGNNNQTGYIIAHDGDFGNLFNNSEVKGAGRAALLDAVRNGAMTLDAYDGYLPTLYRQYGFEPVARIPFNDEFAPANWDYEKLGRPDIIHMAYTGGDRNTILARVGTFDEYRPPEFLATDWDEAHRRAIDAARNAEGRLAARRGAQAISALDRGIAEGSTGVSGQPLARPAIGGSGGTVDPSAILGQNLNPAVRSAAERALSEGEELPVAFIEHLDRAYAVVKENRSGSVANFLSSFPGIKQVYGLYNRGSDIPENILTAYNAQAGVLNRLPQEMFPSSQRISQEMEQAFGKEAMSGGRAAVQFIGTPEQASVRIGNRTIEWPALNTIKDVIDRPNLYNLTPAQKNAVKNFGARENFWQGQINSEYFTGLPTRDVPTDWARIPTVGRGEIRGTESEEALKRTLSVSDIASVEGKRTPIENEILNKRKLIENLDKKIANGERVKFNTTIRNRARQELDELVAANVETDAFTRWSRDMKRFADGKIQEKSVFVPETNVRVLMQGMDDAKIRTAAKSVLNAGFGGMTRKQIVEEVESGLFEKRENAYKIARSLSEKLNRLELQSEQDLEIGRKLRSERSKLRQRLEMRQGESGRANEFLVRRLNAVEERLDKLRNNETRKGVQNRINSIYNRVDEIAQSEKLNPEGAPAISALEEDFENIAKILDDKIEAKQIKRDARIDEFTNMLDEAKRNLREVRLAYRSVTPEREGYEFVYNGVNRYFKKDEAEKINKLLEISNGSIGRAFDAISSINATILSGDIGPLFGQQGQIAFWASPIKTTSIVAKSLVQSGLSGDLLRGFRASHLAERASQNPQWARYAEALQFNLRPQLPEEFGGGWLFDAMSKLPMIKGQKAREALEGMYSAIRLYQLETMDDLVQSAMSNGVPANDAIAAAASTVTNLVPTSRPAVLGQSPAFARAARVPLTSITFATKPFVFTHDVFSGIVKYPLGKATLREKQSAALGSKMFLRLGVLSATSQMINAMIEGEDEEGIAAAGLRAINPEKGNRYFMALQMPGTDITVPLGTTFRSALQAMAPQMTKIPFTETSVPIPYAGVPRFYANRIQPFGRRGAEAIFNKPWYGKPGSIRDEEADTLTQFAQGLFYVAIGALPLTVSQPYESWREEQSLSQGAIETGAQFLGLNVQYPYEQTGKVDKMPSIKGIGGTSRTRRSGIGTVPKMGK